MGLKASSRRVALRHSTAVDEWLWRQEDEHPQIDLMRRVRDVILVVDPRVEECLKWSCPTFVFNGNIVSINPQAKQFLSLMFHLGGKIPGHHPVLSGAGATCKYVRVDNARDLRAKRRDIERVVRDWCRWKQ